VERPTRRPPPRSSTAPPRSASAEWSPSPTTWPPRGGRCGPRTGTIACTPPSRCIRPGRTHWTTTPRPSWSAWPGKLDGCADIETQIDGFRWHIDLAKRVRKPLMIHNREADHDLLTVLLDEGPPDRVIFHCFSSDTNMALSCVAEGYILSFSGTVSFKNAHELREAAKVVPDDQILVETDAPYLTPHPFRGAPNEPYCLPYTVRALAEVRGQDPLELAKITTDNARRVYRL
jgi:Tat protein secretion system quality control protein TatD with DNase activity